METLLDAFPRQSLDFFGALRSATYDGQIREWIERDVIATSLSNEDANLSDMSRRLVSQYAPNQAKSKGLNHKNFTAPPQKKRTDNSCLLSLLSTRTMPSLD